MKKLLLWAALAASMSASAQVKVNFQTACHPADVKHYDTKTLRERFVMEKVMVADEINLTYSHYDRFIFGGAMPVTKDLKLEAFPELRAPYFLHNREIGIINTAGDGVVIVDGQEYPLAARRRFTSDVAIWARIRTARALSLTKRSSSARKTLRTLPSSTLTLPLLISTTRRSG